MNEGTDLVVDSSVLINVLVVRDPVDLLGELNKRLWVTPEVVGELRRHPDSRQVLEEVILAKSVEVCSRIQGHADLMVELAGAEAPDDLGDGEASTIAHGVLAKVEVALDERKARRICKRRFPELKLVATVDLLRELDANDHAQMERLREATFDALKKGRMRVLPEHLDWIVELLGSERCTECPSLPGRLRVGRYSSVGGRLP